MVTGGAGYIGSHTCLQLSLQGYTPITYDNLSTGNRWAVKWGPLIEADILETDNLIQTLETYKPETIIHFAAKAYVGESKAIPLAYYQNNVAGTLSVLDAAARCGVKNFIFSSSCAVYGQPETLPVTEETPINPISPYGRTKAYSEQIIEDVCKIHGIRPAILRYFNAAGAEPESGIGEHHDPETHLIPNAIFAALNRQTFTLFGCDYPTPDGTCIRDYIHVSDFAAAHVLAQKHLSQGGDRIAANLGHGSGLSAKKVLNTIERTTNRCITTHLAPAREGDLSRIDANYRFAKKTLRWNPSRSSLDRIIKDVVAWHKIKYSQPHSKLDTTCH